LFLKSKLKKISDDTKLFKKILIEWMQM